MNHLHDAWAFEASLTAAFSEHYGMTRTWSLAIKDAWYALRDLRKRIGDTHYDDFLHCAVQGLDAHAATEDPGGPQRDHIATALHRRFGDHRPEGITVAWARTVGMDVLLDERDL